MSGVPLGQRLAEKITRTVGSWKFIIIQSVVLLVWIVFNTWVAVNRWDPYPYILMNLFLSMQAAYTAPMILMSQNRQSQADRVVMYGDYILDKKTHKNIKELQQKIDESNSLLEKIVQKLEKEPKL